MSVSFTEITAGIVQKVITTIEIVIKLCLKKNILIWYKKILKILWTLNNKLNPVILPMFFYKRSVPNPFTPPFSEQHKQCLQYTVNMPRIL